MYNLTGNFVLNKMFLNLKKKKKKQRGRAEKKRKAFLDKLPGALGSGRWPASHRWLHTIGCFETTSQWQQSQTKRDQAHWLFFWGLAIYRRWVASAFAHGFLRSMAGSFHGRCVLPKPALCARLASRRWPVSHLHDVPLPLQKSLFPARGCLRPRTCTSFSINTRRSISKNHVLPDRRRGLHFVPFVMYEKSCISWLNMKATWESVVFLVWTNVSAMGTLLVFSLPCGLRMWTG